MNQIILWASTHENLLVWMGLISLIVFIASLASLPWLVALIPEDYFISSKRQLTSWKNRFPGMWVLVFVVKNTIGYLLLLSGMLMLFLPGQGVLTMVAGLLMMDYHGKFALERRIALSPSILSKLNWLRKKANRPPLKTDL